MNGAAFGFDGFRAARSAGLLGASALLMLAVALSVLTAPPASVSFDASQHGIEGAYAKLPVSFIENRGQIDRRALYYAQGGGYGFYFTRNKAVLSLTKGKRTQVLDLSFLGANPHPRLVAERPGAGTVSYMRGSDRSQWRTGLTPYGRLAYRDLWPGIDMVFFGREGKLEYEFHVKPGADPSKIRLAYRGAEGVSVTRSGDLAIRTPLGTLTDSRPRSWQDGRAVPSRFALGGGGSYGFELGSYERRRPVVIDPGLAYSTYLGGGGIGGPSEQGNAIAVDSSGSAYVTGFTYSNDFPTTPGAYDTSNNDPNPSPRRDVFVTKLDPGGTALSYSTFLGGQTIDEGHGIAVDGSGSAYVTGLTYSTDFPTTAGAFDTVGAGNGVQDAFVAKLDPSGSSLTYSTFLAGQSNDQGYAIAVDGTGGAYVTGLTASSNFPTTPGAYDTTFNGGPRSDAFVTKLNTSGSALTYSTFLGGALHQEYGTGIAVDGGGSAYVSGRTLSADFPATPGAFDTSLGGTLDGFVAKFSPTGSALAYATYLGGGGGDETLGIGIDTAGSAYVTGYTSSADFPTTIGSYDVIPATLPDGFVTKLDAAGATLAYSTYFGGSGLDVGRGIAVDDTGRAFVTGETNSADYPTTPGAFDTSLGFYDAAVTELNSAGSALVYSTLVGGANSEVSDAIAVDSARNPYITGNTYSPDFPTNAGAFDTTYNAGAGNGDAFVTKLDLAPPSYVRPKAATPIYASLAPAYTTCASPNRTHAAPLSFASCNPPQQVSQYLTVGNPPAAPANFTGYARFRVLVGAPGGSDDSDLSVTADMADVRCGDAIQSTACGATNAGGGPDYIGYVKLITSLRITDRINGPGSNEQGTTVDMPIEVPVQCSASPSTSIGGSCALTTTIDTLYGSAAAVPEGKRAIWALGEVGVLDGGPSGDNTFTGATVFARQGVFVP